MDKEQKELQSLGFFGIWRGSFKIISTWSQVFLRVALALTLPLSFVYLAHIEINHLLSQNISDTLNTLATIVNITGGNTTPFVYDPNNKFQEIAGMVLLRDMARYTLFHIAYLIFHLISSFLPAGVIYTVACIYSGKSVVTVKEIMYVIPKVWKRLMVNLLCVMGIKFVYNSVFNSIMFITILAHPIDPHSYIAKYDLSDILSSVGVWYMDVIWQLASTISVLEESYGLQALRKSKKLIKGKVSVSFAIFSVCVLLFKGTIWVFDRFVVVDRANVGMIGRVGFGVISLVLLSFVILLGEVVRMVLYLVCKSYHNEQIDKFT